MRDPVEDQSDETSKVQRETVGSAPRPRSSRRSKSRPSDKGNPSKLPQPITARIEEVPVVENDQTVQRADNGAVEGGTKDQQLHHVKHVKRKKEKAKTDVSDEEAPLDRMLHSAPEDENILPSSTPDNAVGKARRRSSSKARPKTGRNRKEEAEARGTTGGSPVVDDGILSHSPPGTAAATTKTILLPLVKVDVADPTAGKKKATATPNVQDEAESNEVGRRVEKPRRKSKAKPRASNTPNENVGTAEDVPLKSPVPVIEEPPEEETTDIARTTHRQRPRPGQTAGPTAVLVELTELPTRSSAVLPPDNPFEEPEEAEQTQRKAKKHEKKRHRKKTKDGTNEGGLHGAGSAEKTEHEPLKPPRPPLILSPSDAAIFQRPEPPPELGPAQKRPPTVHRKVPQTALLMGLTRKNKVSPYDPSTMRRSTSETSDEALMLPTVQPSGSAEELIDEETKSQNKTHAVTAEDSTISGHKSHKHKKDKKTRRHKSRSEIKKSKSPEKSVRKSEVLTLPSVEAVEQRVEKDEPEVEVAPLVTAEKNEDEEDDHDSAQKKGKKKKKKRRDEDSVQMNVEDDNAAGKKRKKKKKPRDTTQEDSRGAANEAAKNVEPTESEAARLADELYGKAVGNFFILEDVLGKGGFGEARRGKHITTGKKYAIKLERTNDGNESLADEYKIYQILGNHNGFPKCYYFGVGPKNSNALVMDLLGPSLEDYFRAMERQWSLKAVCLVALQILERIEYVHSKGFVYSDIKPENFLVGLPEEHQDSTVFLIDFGLAQQFKDKDTGKYCYDENLKTHPVGTMRYMSVRSHEARSLSYRDDLESIGYLIIYFIRGRLPWQGSGIKDRAKKVKAVGLKKKNMTIEELCDECPTEIQEYMKYVRSIQFYAEPKYERLRNFFSHILATNKWTDDGQFDWIGKSYDFSKTKKSESVLGKPPDGTTAEDDTVKPEHAHRILVGTPVAVVAPRPPKAAVRQTTDSSNVQPEKAPAAPKPKAGRRTAAAAARKSKVEVARASLPGATDPTIDPMPVTKDKDLDKPPARAPTVSSYNPPSTPYDKPTRKKKNDSSCACC